MRIDSTLTGTLETDADTVAIGLYEGKGVAHDVPGGTLQALVDSGEARTAYRKLAVAHAEGKRWILVGLGPRDQFDAERARVAAALVHGRARELGARRLCWEVPHHAPDDAVAGLVEGTVLASYRFVRYRPGEEDDGRDLEALTLSAHHDVAEIVRLAALVARAQNRARELQDAAPNDATPTALAARAEAVAAEHAAVSVETWDRARIESEGMGAFAAVARAAHEEPRLIVLRHEPPGAGGPLVAFVGKGVTWDSGGYWLKPHASMPAEKYDMSGAAAVIEAIAAIAELGLPIRILGVVGATENALGGGAMRPSDVLRALDGTTIEMNNSDAEGRLILADCLTYARREGAERLVDIATLTGGAVVALGKTFAALLANDEAWAAEVSAAALASGERVWRLPLDPEYAERVRGQVAELTNLAEKRSQASAITAAEFLHHFAGDVPWAHLDIAGVADDVGKPYAPRGGTGWGVRLLVALARRLAAT
jgi:leucyl aminopeptidase